MKLLLASLIALTPVSASADVIRWETTSQTCWRSVYREEYTPGTRKNPGYVTSWEEDIQVPCENRRTGTIPQTIQQDDNDCTDGKVAGAILGGGAGAALSRDDGRWWAIPLGVGVGSKIGCDAAGG